MADLINRTTEQQVLGVDRAEFLANIADPDNWDDIGAAAEAEAPAKSKGKKSAPAVDAEQDAAQ
jgi:hypothetical protein